MTFASIFNDMVIVGAFLLLGFAIREVVKPLIEETKKTYTTEVKPVVQQTGTSAVDAKNTIVETASNLNQLRKKFRF